jgi:hypothetical protein
MLPAPRAVNGYGTRKLQILRAQWIRNVKRQFGDYWTGVITPGSQRRNACNGLDSFYGKAGFDPSSLMDVICYVVICWYVSCDGWWLIMVFRSAECAFFSSLNEEIASSKVTRDNAVFCVVSWWQKPDVMQLINQPANQPTRRLINLVFYSSTSCVWNRQDCRECENNAL